MHQSKTLIRRFAKLGLLALTVMTLSALPGCRDRAGCPSDFAEAGLADGRLGKAPSVPSPSCEISDAERKHYVDARREGLKWFCDGKRVFTRARQGEQFDVSQCPLEWKTDAEAASIGGFEVFELEQKARSFEAQSISSNERGLFAEASGFDMRAKQTLGDVEALLGVAVTKGWLPNPATAPLPPMPVGEGSVLKPGVQATRASEEPAPPTP
jgi:hypothetical protein